MIDNNMKVILLEVNSSPSMDKSNKILGNMIKEFSEDYIKVIIDKNKDKGKFKLICNEKISEKKIFNKEGFFLNGKKLKEKTLKKI